jgi:putative nucleotidyltransferase with HDIG domain
MPDGDLLSDRTMNSDETTRIDIEPDTEMTGQIARAKNELEEMIDLNPQVIMLLDKHGRIVRANKATLEFFNIANFSLILYKELPALLVGADAKALETLTSQHQGYRNVEVTVDTPGIGNRTLNLVLVSSGETRDFSILIINDVSGESEKAQDLEKQYKKEAVQALTGALMHNINQPLTVIMMRAQMLKFSIEKDKMDPDELRRGLDDVMMLAMSVADMLQAVDRPNDFVTEPYVEGVEIMDLQKSGNENAPLDLTCSTMLDVLLTALDNRIPRTILHSRGCGALAFAIAQKVGLDSRKCETARQAGYVHDIGKLSIADKITLKPSSLSKEELDIMRTHSETGYQIVRGLIFLEDEADAVRTHHEFWDGTGYPQGLAGEDIPATARVVAAADAFEAMMSGRPYRDAISLSDVLEEFRKNRGTQFDPAVVDAVIDNAEELEKILRTVEKL